MKELLAGIVAAVLSIFGGHQAVSDSASNAAAVASVAPSAIVATSSAQNPASVSAPPTIINQPVIERIVERTVQTAAPGGGYVTQEAFTTAINELSDRFGRIISGSTYPAPASNFGSGGIWNAIAASNRIDQLSGTNLSDITVEGVSGLTDADIPDGITASNYLPISGGTLTGDATLGSTTVGMLTATDIISKGPTIDVRAYGAKGDGTTDDRSAIQAAIDAASSAGGGRVTFAPGKTYLVGVAPSTKQITANSGAFSYSYCIDVPSNVALDFRGATLKLASGAGAVLLSNRNSADTTDTNISILNAFLDGNNVTLTNEALVWFVGVTDLTFNARIQNTTHVAAQFANITRLYSAKMEAVNVEGQAFFIGSVATNGDVRDSYIGDITTNNITEESQPNFPGNPVAAVMTNSRIGSIESKRSDAGIKIYWTTDRLSIGSVLLQDGGSLTSGNSGFKVQGDGTNNPKNVSVGSVTAQGQYGAGLYIQYADSTHIDSYNGNGNALLGNVPDVWVAGTSTSVTQIHSINSGNVGVAIRSDASNYHIGAMDIRNPGQVVTAAAVSIYGGTGGIDAINALDDQGTPTMTRGLDVNGASADIRVGDFHSAGQSGTPINVVAGATALIDLHGETVNPTQLTANQNNYDPSRTAEVWRLTSDAQRTITGIASPWLSRQITINNIGSFNIVLANQSVSSTDIYRIITGTAADVTVAPGEVAVLIYDSTTQRWLLKGRLLSTVLLQSPTFSGTIAGTPTWGSGQIFPTLTISSTSVASVFSGGFLSLASSTITSGLFSMSGGASTTNITASGTGYFGLAAFTNTSGTSTIASGQGFTIGSSQFVVQQGSGRIGIGTDSPTRALTVAGSNLVATFGLTTASAYAAFGGDRAIFGYDSGLSAALVQGLSGKGIAFNVNNNTAGQGTAMIINTSGNVGIGTTTPWRTLSVTGTVGFDGLTGSTGAGSLCLSANKEVVYNSGSDSCLSSTRATKHDILPLNLSALDMVTSLQPVSFIYNNDASSTVRYGFIAEDAAAVDAHLATYDAAGAISGIDDRSVIALTVRAVQNLISTISEFADRFTTRELTFTRSSGDEITVRKANIQQANVQELCVGSTCLTESQVQALLNQAGQQPSAPSETPQEPETEEPQADEPILEVSNASEEIPATESAAQASEPEEPDSSIPEASDAPPTAPDDTPEDIPVTGPVDDLAAQ